MRLSLLSLILLAVLCSARAAPSGGEHPGYGVVQSVTRLPQDKAASASAGSSSRASSPKKQRDAMYLVRVRLDDGSIQIRQVKGGRLKAGSRVLVTNAGDVLPE